MSLISNIDKIKRGFHDEFGDAVDSISSDMQYAIVDQIEGENYLAHLHSHAKGYRDGTIVDTGTLRDSIQSAIDINSDPVFWAYAGSNLDYAYETHEIGSYGGHIEPRPFVEDALGDEKKSEYTSTIQSAFERALAGFV